MRFGVVTTATRGQYLETTLASLRRAGVEAEVFCDLERGLTANHRAALLRMFETDDRALLFQDDLLACSNLRGGVDAFVSRFPKAPVVSFFTMQNRLAAAHEREGFFWYWNPSDLAVLYRREFYLRFAAWLDENRSAKGWKNHDTMLERFCRQERQKCLGCSPSLVQHVGVKSTMGHAWMIGKNLRQSATWRGEDFDAGVYFGALWR